MSGEWKEAADTRRCTGYEQHAETGMVRRCSLPSGHEGRHRHMPLAGSLAIGPDLAAGGSQEPRSKVDPTSPTGEEGSAAREAPTATFPCGGWCVEVDENHGSCFVCLPGGFRVGPRLDRAADAQAIASWLNRGGDYALRQAMRRHP